MIERSICLSISLCVGLFPQSVFSAPPDFVEGEVLVIFKPAKGNAAARTALDRHSLSLARQYETISRKRGSVCGLVRGKNLATARLIELLKADPAVESAEPNYLRRIFTKIPNDPDFPKLWGLRNTGQTVYSKVGTSGVDIQFLAAWKLARTTPGEVVVGVMDTGIDITHPDLAPNVWQNPRETADNGIDDDGNGYVDDVHGYDFAAGTAAIHDARGHGTHVAGIIAAAGNNLTGVTGVQYRAKILPLTVTSNGDSISSSAMIAAMEYAMALKQQGADIVALNASFGGSFSSNAERITIEALRDANIVLCVAAGNESTNNDFIPSYPANYPTSNILSVAAITQNDGLATFSNYGATTVDLAAPGENIYSTRPISQTATSATSVSVGGISYAALPLEYSGITPAPGLTGTIHPCGLGYPADFPAAVSGNIALILRGEITFSGKIANAKNAGAIAAIIYDNTADPLTITGWTLGAAGSWIPALQVTQATGQSILTQIPASSTVLHGKNLALAYQFLDGTSMACPHVAGAVAFAAFNFPAESLSQRITRINNNVTLVPALAGKMTTGGRLDLLKIVDTDGDGLPDWWENETLTNLAQTATADGDGDGFTNLDEFLAGTNPTDPASHLAFSSIATASDGAGKHFVLTFPSIEDRNYRIEWSGTLQAGSWRDLGEPVTGTGEILKVRDLSAWDNAERRFYRMSVFPD